MMTKKVKLTAKQKRNRAPLVPGSATTYGQTVKDRNAAVKLQYGPTEQAVVQRQANVGGWFDQYKADLAAAAQAQATQYQTATQGIRDTATASAQAGSQQQQQLASQAQQDAAARGATYSGTPTTQGQAGTDLRHTLADAFASAIAAQGTAYQGNTQGQIGVGSAAQLSERLRAQKDYESLQGDKAAYGSKYMADARTAEQRNVLEQAAFGLKQQTEADTVASQRASRVVSRKNNAANNATSIKNTNTRTDAARQKAKAQADAKEQVRVGKVRDTSKKGLGRLHDIAGRWNHYATLTNPKTKIVTDQAGKQTTQVVTDKAGNPVKVKASPGQIRSQLLKDGFTASEIHLALKIRGGEMLTPADVSMAHELGIRVPRALLPSRFVTQTRPN